MARAAVLERLTWQVATVVEWHDETPTARTLRFSVDGWAGHVAGQHVDVRLSAPDGYQATRSYSIGSAPAVGEFELTVQRLPDGEVSSYLAGGLDVGRQVEIRGPLGGWFVWRPQQREAVQLIGGGSGVVPLMSMLRAKARSAATASGAESAAVAGDSPTTSIPPGGQPIVTALPSGAAPMRLLYSVRDPVSVLYAAELTAATDVSYAYTRAAPSDWSGVVGRVDAESLTATTFSPDVTPTCYVCGPTPFVETIADLLVRAGHDPRNVRTERFGDATGGAR